MSSFLQTPILFLLFNRKNTAVQVFTEIKKVQPKHLYIAADGGRDEAEHQICLDVRESILSMIDWECDVHTNFREENAGCGKNVSEAITWFFEHVEEGIILEDDCLPSPSFFFFCQENLEKHRNNETILSINGTCLEEDKLNHMLSYRLTKYPLIWGWATWRRAWKHYRFEIDSSNNLQQNLNLLFNQDEGKFWNSILIQLQQNKIDTWDYQWCFSVWSNNGSSIQPNLNLVSNIGFDKFATHTKSDPLGLSQRKTPNERLPLIHTKKLQHNHKRDRLLYTKYFNPSSPKEKFNQFSNLTKRWKQKIVEKIVNILSQYFEVKQSKNISKENNPYQLNLSDNSFIESILTIENGNNISIEKDTSIGKLAWIAAIKQYENQKFKNPKIYIGNNTRIGNFVCITAVNSIKIGNGVLISDHFYTSDHSHLTNPNLGSPIKQNLEMKGEVIIGDNCFIGMRVSVLPGVSLGNNCIVGAHSVVTKSFPPFTMLAGIPAKVIKKYNFDTNQWQ